MAVRQPHPPMGRGVTDDRRAGYHFPTRRKTVISKLILETTTEAPPDLDAALRAIGRDWSKLGARLKTLDHEVKTSCSRLSIRLHYPTIRDATATVHELVSVATLYLAHFCLPQSELKSLYARKDQLSSSDLHEALTQLDRRARDLFIRARSATSRSGEAGELLLYLLTEWILGAPQIVAKMSLKTSSAMPVHGSDGIHVKFLPATGHLVVYSGEAKLHADIGDAIRSAVASIATALQPDKLDHELHLVRRDLDLSGLDETSAKELLRFLDPLEPRSANRIDAVTCLLGFDFGGYSGLTPGSADATFCQRARDQLERSASAFADALEKAGLGHRTVELFLLPLPSVEQLRTAFQARIGDSAG